jgi:hypothetical protein
LIKAQSSAEVYIFNLLHGLAHEKGKDTLNFIKLDGGIDGGRTRDI